MIPIPHNKITALFDNDHLNMIEMNDDILNPSVLKTRTNNQPFVGEFDRGDWDIRLLKQAIHDRLGDYQLFQRTHVGDHGIEDSIWISFSNPEDELLFKLTWL